MSNMPVRGPAPMMTPEEFQNIKRCFVHCENLIPADMARLITAVEQQLAVVQAARLAVEAWMHDDTLVERRICDLEEELGVLDGTITRGE